MLGIVGKIVGKTTEVKEVCGGPFYGVVETSQRPCFVSRVRIPSPAPLLVFKELWKIRASPRAE